MQSLAPSTFYGNLSSFVENSNRSNLRIIEKVNLYDGRCHDRSENSENFLIIILPRSYKICIYNINKIEFKLLIREENFQLIKSNSGKLISIIYFKRITC